LLYRVLKLIPQLSVEPLFTSAAAIVTFDEASRTVFFRNNYAILSSTVTMAFLATFPFLSVTLKVNVFAPSN
jgi:hypothetical protein